MSETNDKKSASDAAEAPTNAEKSELETAIEESLK